VFRLTEQAAADRLVIKLEGRCSAEVVDALVASWVTARITADGRPIWIDLTDVLHVDDVVLRQLARMHTAGARFLARGCLMHYVVRQITDQAASAE
jgi:anti-anti-sigma regulatory factor